MDEIGLKIAELPSDAQQCVKNYISSVYENGRRFGIDQATNKLKQLHGEALAKHNYYAHAAIEVRKLRKANGKDMAE